MTESLPYASIDKFKIKGTYLLYVCIPIPHAFSKLRQALSKYPLEVPHESSHTFSLRVESTQMDTFARIVLSVLNEHEMEDSPVLLLPQHLANASPILTLPHTMNLKKLVALTMSQWLVNLIENKQLSSWYQPIVDAKSREVFAWEAFLRARAGNTIYGAPELLATARSSEMLYYLDRKSRIGAIAQADQYYPQLQRLFINFNPLSIYDPFFCLQSTNKAVENTHFQPADIVFEVTESDLKQNRPHLLEIVRYYRENHYGVALDDIGSSDGIKNLLSELKPDYIKLDMNLVRDIHTSSAKQMTVTKIVEQAQALAIKTVATGIETEEEMSFLSTLPIEYFQGFFFAKSLSPETIQQEGVHSTY